MKVKRARKSIRTKTTEQKKISCQSGYRTRSLFGHRYHGVKQNNRGKWKCRLVNFFGGRETEKVEGKESTQSRKKKSQPEIGDTVRKR